MAENPSIKIIDQKFSDTDPAEVVYQELQLGGFASKEAAEVYGAAVAAGTINSPAIPDNAMSIACYPLIAIYILLYQWVVTVKWWKYL